MSVDDLRCGNAQIDVMEIQKKDSLQESSKDGVIVANGTLMDFTVLLYSKWEAGLIGGV